MATVLVDFKLSGWCRACGQALMVGARGVMVAAIPARIAGNGGRVLMTPLLELTEAHRRQQQLDLLLYATRGDQCAQQSPPATAGAQPAKGAGGAVEVSVLPAEQG